MEQRLFGKTGMVTSVLGFGSSEIGFGQSQQAVVDRMLNASLDTGLNVIDTAECYKEAESLIGNAVSHRRSDYYLFTKCGHNFGVEMGLPDWHPDLITASIENSLRRLKTDYVDLIQLHSCNRSVLAEGTVIERLQLAREQGKTRFIGYSGDGDDAVYAIELGVFDSLQTSVNIADQESIERLLPLCQERQMGVIAKRPIANFAWANGALPPASNYALPYWERLQLLRYPFLLSSPQDSVNTALRFTLAQPAVSTMIVGTQNPDRWIQNSAAVALGPLAPSEVKAIRDRWVEIGSGWTGLG